MLEGSERGISNTCTLCHWQCKYCGVKMSRKTFLEKIQSKHDLPKIKDAPDVWGGGSMLIPHPKEVMEIIDCIPKGNIMEINALRSQLAEKHNVDICCPMTTGIFIKIVAEAYLEGSINSPYWRVVKKNGELNHKFPGGIDEHRNQLSRDGLSVIKKGEKFYIKDAQTYLYS